MQSRDVFSPDLSVKISIFSKTVHTIRTKLFTVILHRIRALCVQLHQNLMAGISETWPKLVLKKLPNDKLRTLFFNILIRLMRLWFILLTFTFSQMIIFNRKSSVHIQIHLHRINKLYKIQ